MAKMEITINAKEIAEMTLNEYTYRGKTLREWVDMFSDGKCVPWSWLEQIADGQWCNYASGWVYEAKQRWMAEQENRQNGN